MSAKFTITISFGPALPAFQQHYAGANADERARRYMRLLREKLICGINHRTGETCIERVELWRDNAVIQVCDAMDYNTIPRSIWLPPKGETEDLAPPARMGWTTADRAPKAPPRKAKGEAPVMAPATALPPDAKLSL